MPKYRFEFVGDQRSVTVFTDLSDHETAKREAIEAMAEMDLDAIRYNADRSRAIKIFDEEQGLIGVVTPLVFTPGPRQPANAVQRKRR